MVTSKMPSDDRFLDTVVMLSGIPVTRREYIEIESRAGTHPHTTALCLRSARVFEGPILSLHQQARIYRDLPPLPKCKH